jgi:transposase
MTKRTAPFSPEVRECAVRMVRDHEGEHGSQWSAIQSIAAKIGCSGETPRNYLVSSGHRNTILHVRKNSVECLCQRLPVQRFARSAVEGGNHSSKIVHAVGAQIRAVWEVLSQQPVRILGRPPLPGRAWIAEVGLQTRVDP